MADPILAALLAGLAAAGATAAGALPALSLRRLTPRIEDTLLGFGAGIMLCAPDGSSREARAIDGAEVRRCVARSR